MNAFLGYQVRSYWVALSLAPLLFFVLVSFSTAQPSAEPSSQPQNTPVKDFFTTIRTQLLGILLGMAGILIAIISILVNRSSRKNLEKQLSKKININNLPKFKELLISIVVSDETVRTSLFHALLHLIAEPAKREVFRSVLNGDLLAESPTERTASAGKLLEELKRLVTPPDFVIVTALSEERDAVLDKLPGYRKLPPSEDDIRTYFQAELPVTFPDGKTGTYRVIVMPLLGMGRVEAATATKDAIQRWHPPYIMLVGIAGGIAARDVSIGDILISDQIVDYELQKFTQQGPEIRWEVHRAASRLLIACQNVMDESWQELVRVKRPGRSKVKLHIGPIASGDKVMAIGDVLKRYREVWSRLIGVEMEAAGVATAAFQSPKPPGFFMVRGVSDLADEQKNSADVEKWRSYACDAAASFAIALLKSGPVPLQKREQ